MFLSDKDNYTKKDNLMNIKIDKIHQQKIKTALKRGIYKELYKRQFLTETQLDTLLRGDF